MNYKEKLNRLHESVFNEAFSESINYNKILNSKNKKIISDSVKAAIFDGNKNVNINTDKMISLYTDKLSPKDYDAFDWNKAEDIILKYANDLFNKSKKK